MPHCTRCKDCICASSTIVPFLGGGLLAFLFVIAESLQSADSVILHTLSKIAGMTLVHK